MQRYYLIVEEGADIYQCPSKREKTSNRVTIGDLHANAMNLLYFLVREGIVEISNNDYLELARLYQAKQSKENLLAFKKIIQEKMKVINLTALLRLIGDETADRGQNDFFILIILAALRQQNVKIQTILSNHGYELVLAFEKGGKLFSKNLGAQAISMANMQDAIDKGWITKDEVEQLIKEVYLPSLKLISYSLDEDTKGMRIYSHAPIDVNVIASAAAKLGISFKDDTAQELGQTIDAINHAFQQEYVANRKVHELFKGLETSPSPEYTDYKVDPFLFMIWNRQYNILDRKPNHKGYAIGYGHGHDSAVPSQGNVANLDRQLGKLIDMNKGRYTAVTTAGFSVLSLEQRRLRKAPEDDASDAEAKDASPKTEVDALEEFFTKANQLFCDAEFMIGGGGLKLQNLVDVIKNPLADQQTKDDALSAFVTASQPYMDLRDNIARNNKKARERFSLITGLITAAAFIIGAAVAVAGAIGITLLTGGTLTIPYLIAIGAAAGAVTGGGTFLGRLFCCKPAEQEVDPRNIASTSQAIIDAADVIIHPKMR